MRILWVSNGPYKPFAYGLQTAEIIRRIPQDRHQIAVLDFTTQNHVIQIWEGIRVYGMGYQQWGVDMAAPCCKHWRADVMITFFDLHPWAGNMGQTWFTECAPAIALCPVDHDPPAPTLINALDGFYKTIAYSRFGEAALKGAGVQNVGYIPHGINLKVFTPGDKAAARKRLQIPEGRFVVGFVGDNKGQPNRKGIPQLLRSFAMLKREIPAAYLYMHALVGEERGGVDVRYLAQQLCKEYGVSLKPDLDYGFPSQFDLIHGVYGNDDMADVYRAIDVLALPTMGEGFGLPLIEAQACGTPVIATDCTACSELVFNGIAVKPLDKWWTAFRSYQFLPDPRGFAKAMQEIARWSDEWREASRNIGLAHVQDYDIDKIVSEQWLPYLDAVERELCLTS